MERNTITSCLRKKRSGRAKYKVNLGNNQKTEAKVPDRTKDGREGKNAVVSEPKPNRNEWKGQCAGKQLST